MRGVAWVQPTFLLRARATFLVMQPIIKHNPVHRPECCNGVC